MSRGRRSISAVVLSTLVWISPVGSTSPLSRRSPGLYTNPDAGIHDAATDAGVENARDAQGSAPTAPATAAPAPPVVPTLPSYETLVDGKPHKVFVTIDDHPGRRTHDYLDLLKTLNIKAVFFIVAYPLYSFLASPRYVPSARMVDSLKRAVREGHVLGNHSVSHRSVCKLTTKQAEWEIGRSQVWTKRVLGVDLTLWRPPNGHLCWWIQKIVARYGLTTIMWDVDDWRSTPDWMARVVQIRARRGQASTIVLFHNDFNKFKRFFQLMPRRP